MGYDLDRFEKIPDKEHVLCNLCGKVLEDPIQCPDQKCQHSFCQTCVFVEMKKESPKCPIDQTGWKNIDFKSPPRVLFNLLSVLRIKCENEKYGCEYTFALESIMIHQTACPYHPEKEVVCRSRCGLNFLRKDFKDHDCIFELQTQVAIRCEELNQKEERLKMMKQRAAEKKERLVQLSYAVLGSLEKLDQELNNGT